ncbi:MAG TPA: NAD-dependent epimerase/dehydratase family protein [Humisphaera sp.]|jgi:CDP-paratose 2-epimerase|nr:NAD-dependent epimerase/dehydratase family protein [Humisphaera sp.]
MKRLLVTGSSGLIGSEVCSYFSLLGWAVEGLDNNTRADLFGPDADTRWNQHRLTRTLASFTHHELDIRDRAAIVSLIQKIRPDAIVHAAAQPSHDLAARRPFDDFDINAVGTLNVLEAARQFSPEAPFVLLSTNKVYGDAPNELALIEKPTRWDYADAKVFNGINEQMRIDQSKHSLFGASKLAADIMVQEYGRYFGMRTCCLRGGCLTGPYHSGVELHGFLSYLIKCNLERRPYTIFGFKGKQVRDNLHSLDVARFIHAFIQSPRPAEVYNLGGGRANSCSILEAIAIIESISGRKMITEYCDQSRAGDHICYISDLAKARAHYPAWTVSKSLADIFTEIHATQISRESLSR